MDESIEILWIEVQGRNKNIPVLIGVVYQPNSNETEKLIWLEKFERILTEINIEWSGVLHSFLLRQHKKSNKELKNIDRSCY